MLILSKIKIFKRFFSKLQLICILSFVCVLLSNGLLAQQNPTIESIDSDIENALKLVHTDNPEKAIPIFEKAKEECIEIGYKKGLTRIGYSLAIIYFNSSDYNKVINLDNQFLTWGNEINDYENISHLHRLKGCAYSELGLLSKGMEKYDLALDFAHKIESGNSKQYALSIIYSNIANHYMKAKAPQDSIFANINRCIDEAEKITENNNEFFSKKYKQIAYSYIIMGSEYDKIGNADLAEDYYLKSLKIHQTKSIPLVEKVVLLNQLAYFYYNQKSFEKAVKYAEEAILLEKKTSLPQLRRDLFEILSQSYMELNSTEKSKKYLRLYTALKDSISNINRITVDEELFKTISKQEELRQTNISKQKIIYILVVFVLLILVILVIFYYRKQKQIKKIKTIVENLKNKENNRLDYTESIVESTPTSQNKEIKSPIMSADAEKKLLEKLFDFEKAELFLERKVSLPYVASQIETNTKYLSYIIKKYKGKDFNEYINDLRIDYIIQKITHNPIYRQYKINILAEESGFSSHSKFATVFKAKTGVSPSNFIKYFNANA